MKKSKFTAKALRAGSKKRNFLILAAAAMMALFISILFAACAGTSVQKEESLEEITLTIGASRQLSVSIPRTAGNITWESREPAVVSVDQSGIVTAVSFSDSSTGMGRARITAAAENGDTQAFTVIATLNGTVDMMDLPPLKDQFGSYFMLGNIFNPGDVSGGRITNERLTRHYNVLTAENNMKPDRLSPGRGSYSFSDADRMVDTAIASGFKVVGHTLLWHSQIPGWQAALRTNDVSKEDALQYMKDYITAVVSHFKGKIYSWDVLNEAFPDGGYHAGSDWKTVMRADANGNPWYMKIGADFVYEGFLAARLADPGAILYYNDFNLDQSLKAMMVFYMVNDVNTRYKQAYPNANRLLIEGIGMQSHHNTGITPASIRSSLNIFRGLGVKISISELDILSQSWRSYSPNRTEPTSEGKMAAANLYGEYFKVFLDNADIIERVSFWGVFDEQSWRRTGLPLLFEGRSRSFAKTSYYRVIKALEDR